MSQHLTFPFQCLQNKTNKTNAAVSFSDKYAVTKKPQKLRLMQLYQPNSMPLFLCLNKNNHNNFFALKVTVPLLDMNCRKRSFHPTSGFNFLDNWKVCFAKWVMKICPEIPLLQQLLQFSFKHSRSCLVRAAKRSKRW